MNPTAVIRETVKQFFPFDTMYNDRTRTGRRLKFVSVRSQLRDTTMRATIALVKMKLLSLGIRFTSVELRLCSEQQYKNKFYHALVVLCPEADAPIQLDLLQCNIEAQGFQQHTDHSRYAATHDLIVARQG